MLIVNGPDARAFPARLAPLAHRAYLDHPRPVKLNDCSIEL